MKAGVRAALIAVIALSSGFAVWASTGQNLARWRAERTAHAFGTAVWRQDSTRIASLTQSGSARNVLCAVRGPLARHWKGTRRAPRIVGHLRFRDSLQFSIRPDGTAEAFQFVIPLVNPGRVSRYLVPRSLDSGTAVAFLDCLGVRPSETRP